MVVSPSSSQGRVCRPLLGLVPYRRRIGDRSRCRDAEKPLEWSRAAGEGGWSEARGGQKGQRRSSAQPPPPKKAGIRANSRGLAREHHLDEVWWGFLFWGEGKVWRAATLGSRKMKPPPHARARHFSNHSPRARGTRFFPLRRQVPQVPRRRRSAARRRGVNFSAGCVCVDGSGERESSVAHRRDPPSCLLSPLSPWTLLLPKPNNKCRRCRMLQTMGNLSTIYQPI